MDREMYVTQILNKHLLTKDYIKLTQQEALDKLQQMKLLFKDLISSNKDLLSQPELIYFTRSLKSQHRIPLFYGLPKIHKNPISLCPIVSTTNSLSAIFSIWLDYKTKDLLPLIRSHTKNSISIEIIQELQKIHLPNDAVLFSKDAKSMYTSIDTDLALDTLKDFLTVNYARIPTNFPTSLFLRVMEIVMKNNIFSFQDTFWLQLSGTTMGTPVACSYAKSYTGTTRTRTSYPPLRTIFFTT